MSAAQNTSPAPVTLDHPLNKKLTHELIEITPTLAEQWLGQNHGNRNQRGRKITAYARDILNGRWMTTGDTIKFDWNDRLIDGQHRLEAVVEARQTIVALVVRGLDPRVQDVLDVNARRSGSDVLQFNGIKHGTTLIAAVARISTAWDQGLLKRSTSMGTAEMTNSEVLEWYFANQDVTNAVALASRVFKHINSTPSATAFAILLTERIDASDAIEFWMSIADMRTNGAGDPRNTLLKTFRRFEDQGTARTTALQLGVFFRAWNAWRENRTVQKFPAEASDGKGGVAGVTIPEPK
jgi:hypothetical protein